MSGRSVPTKTPSRTLPASGRLGKAPGPMPRRDVCYGNRATRIPRASDHRHSTAHLLANAVQELFPDAQVTIGPVIEDGFYYDFGL